MLDRYVQHEEPRGSPIEEYMKRSEVKKLMKDNIKTCDEVPTKCFVTGIVERAIEDPFIVGYNKQKEEIETPIGRSFYWHRRARSPRSYFDARRGRVGHIQSLYGRLNATGCKQCNLHNANPGLF